MTKHSLTNLYDFITRLIILLEDELDLLATQKNVSAVKIKKNVTDMLGKLVNITAQLNKLSKEEVGVEKNILNKQDQEIIDRFLEKYKEVKK